MDAIWVDLLELTRHPAGALKRRDIPDAPGVYVWFKNGSALYLGKATSLKSRLGTHLGRGNDLSRSTFRRSVAMHERGVPRALSAARPSVLARPDIEAVNTYVQSCEVAWLELSSPMEALSFETAARAEWRPPLNLV